MNLIFDHVLADGYLQHDLAVLAPGGKVIGYGLTSKSAPGKFSLWGAITAFGTIALQSAFGCWGGHKEAEFFNVAAERTKHNGWYREDLGKLADLVLAGKLVNVEGSREWPLEEAPAALASIAAGTHRGKQIIVVAQ